MQSKEAAEQPIPVISLTVGADDERSLLKGGIKGATRGKMMMAVVIPTVTQPSSVTLDNMMTL